MNNERTQCEAGELQLQVKEALQQDLVPVDCTSAPLQHPRHKPGLNHLISCPFRSPWVGGAFMPPLPPCAADG